MSISITLWNAACNVLDEPVPAMATGPAVFRLEYEWTPEADAACRFLVSSIGAENFNSNGYIRMEPEERRLALFDALVLASVIAEEVGA